MKVTVHTFGCKVNTYDSGLIQKNLTEAGFGLASSANQKGLPQIHVLNTCAVTAEATKQAVREIRKIKANNPEAKIIVTGCSAQVDTGSFDQLPSVDLVVANSHKGLLPYLLNQHLKGELTEKVFKSNIFRKDDLEMGGGLEEAHSRSFLKIQDGCNSFCSFCIIPYARGKSRSIPIQELIKRVQELEKDQIQEVVLTGVHIGDYQDETSTSVASAGLESLIETLLLKTKVPRFRLTSLEPIELSERLLDLFQDPRLCPHFHMSIQSASDSVLTGMKRKYGRREVELALEQIAKRVPGAFVGMDVIAGFPGETETHFEETFESLSKSSWNRIHVFPYSERKGTRAEVMPDAVPWAERKHRASLLRQLSLQRYQITAQKQMGELKLALPLLKKTKLKSENKTLTFLSRDYWNIEVPVEPFDALSAKEHWLRITGYRDGGSAANPEGSLIGEVVTS